MRVIFILYLSFVLDINPKNFAQNWHLMRSCFNCDVIFATQNSAGECMSEFVVNFRREDVLFTKWSSANSNKTIPAKLSDRRILN